MTKFLSAIICLLSTSLFAKKSDVIDIDIPLSSLRHDKIGIYDSLEDSSSEDLEKSLTDSDQLDVPKLIIEINPNINRSVKFLNPYPSHIPPKLRFENFYDPHEIEIPNGSLLLFASDDNVSFYHMNKWKITHSEVVLNIDPRILDELCSSKVSDAIISEIDKESLIYNNHILSSDSNSEILAPYVFVSCDMTYKSDAEQTHCIKLLPLETVMNKYNGNMYLRQLFFDIDIAKSLEFISSHIGTEDMYPSSLTILFFQDHGLIDMPELVEFTFPEQYISSLKSDMFKGLAGPEIILKKKF